MKTKYLPLENMEEHEDLYRRLLFAGGKSKLVPASLASVGEGGLGLRRRSY